MPAFTPINRSSFAELIERLPANLRLGGRSLLLEILFRTRRNAGWYDGHVLERGQFVFGEETIGAACCLSRQQVRTLMKWLCRLHFLTIDTSPSGSIGTLEHIDTYIIDKLGARATGNQQQTKREPTGNHISKEKSRKEGTASARAVANPQRAANALRCWTDYAPLPRSVDEAQCIKTLDDLHRIDGVPWDGESGINAICSYAAQQWVPRNFIRAPTALRKWTQARDQKKYEAIQQQLTRGKSVQPAEPGSKEPKYHIAYSTGEPVTDASKRLRRILESHLDCDPDRGFEWTIPEITIAAAKAKA